MKTNKKRFAKGQELQLRPCREAAESLWYYLQRIYETVFVEEVTFIKALKTLPGHAIVRDSRGKKRICNMDDLTAKNE